MSAFLDPPVSHVGHISALGGPGPGRQSPAPVSLHPESKDSSGLSHRSQGNGPPGAVQVAWTVPPVPSRRQVLTNQEQAWDGDPAWARVLVSYCHGNRSAPPPGSW